jgi:HAD superfamily hydrolase (TIGR01450 family)
MRSPTTARVGPFDLANYDACVFDLDGTVWLGATDPIAGAADFLQRCRDEGKRIAYATNAIVHAPETLSERLCEVGLALPGEPVVTSGLVITRTLAERGVERVAAVIPEALATALAGAGIQVMLPDDLDPDDFGPVDSSRALVMASFRGATIGSIERLGRLAAAGHPLFLSSRDPGFPVTGGIEPGGGVLFAALTTMYDVTAIVLGKPSPEYAAAVADAVGGPGQRIAMIGDSQRADIGIAVELGCDSVLLTGYSVRPIDTALPVPTFVASTLADPFEPYGGH